MTTDEPLTRLTVPDPHTVRAWVVKITAVTPSLGTCTIDPNDGDLVTEVPYWGSAPPVGSIQVALLFDGLLGVISTGSGLTGVATANGVAGSGTSVDPVRALHSNVWGQGALAGLGTDSLIGNEIYIDSAGNLRGFPQFITAAATPRSQADPPNSYPLGQSIMSLTGALAASGGWPAGASALVVTIRRQESDGTVQWWFRNTSTANLAEVRYRAGGGASGPWTPWIVVVGDSGWVDITVNSGFAAQSSGERPAVRMRNGIVHVRGGWANTGISAINTTYTVGSVPAGYRPMINVVSRAGTSSGLASAGLWVTATGDVQIRTGPNLSSYYLFGGQSWLTD